jgi:CBS domain-containing protein
MRCETVMKKDVVYALPTDSARQAAALMRDENIGFLPVCDDDGCVVGVLTDRDLAIRVCADGLSAADVNVEDTMTREVVACRPDDELTDAERLMAEYCKSRVVVTDDAYHLLGVISLADVVQRDSNRHAAHTLRKIVSREYRF